MNGKRELARKYFGEKNYKEAFGICKGWKDLFGDDVKYIQRAYEIMVGGRMYQEIGIKLEDVLPMAMMVFYEKLVKVK